MKKIASLLSALLLLGACDYLDIVPDDVATLDHAFTDAVSAERYLLNCYAGLPTEGDPRYNPAFLGSDEFWFPRNDTRWSEFSNHYAPANILFSLQSSNNPSLNYYEGRNSAKGLWKTIRKCNIFLNKVPTIDNLSVLNRSRWIAEAKTIKAYCFFYLVRMYGPIPIVDYEVDVDATPEELRFERNTFEECITYITDLIDDAAPSLPLFISKRREELGRFTQPAAYMLKAKTLILAASPQFNDNSYYHDFTGKNGKVLFGPKDDNRWIAARDACKEAIAICVDAGIDGLYEYSNDGTLNAAAAMEHTIRGSITDEQWSKELILGGGTNSSEFLQRTTMARFSRDTYQGAQPTTLSVALSFINKFYTNKGIPTEEDPDWSGKNLYALREPVGGELDYITATNPEFNFDREPRFYAAIGFNRGTWYGNGSVGTTPHTLRAYIGEEANLQGDAVYMSTTGIFAKKMNNMKNETLRAGTSIQNYPFPVMRLADLYLLYAECINEVEGPTDEAKGYINQVRWRAGLDDVDTSWARSTNPNKPNTRDGLRDIIQRERTIELAFEGHRFWDVRRWMKLEAEMNHNISAWNIKGRTAEEYFQEVIKYRPTLQIKDYLWPMRLELLTINPNLKQTKGW